MYCEEIRPYWLLVTKGYGLSVNDIDWSSPADLEPYAKAKRIEEIMFDVKQWQLGQYIGLAFGCMFPKGKYPKKPMFQIEDDTNLLDEKNYEQKLKKALSGEER